MEDLKAADWISLFSSVGTFFGSVFVLVTLFEMKRQRKQSYMPELVIPDVCFNYSNDYATYSEIWSKDDKNFLSLDVHNIGLWAAKDISFKWSYDIHDMIGQFYRLSSEEKGDLEIDSDQGRLIYKCNGVILAGSSLSIDNSHFDFLLPCKDELNHLSLPLPNSYITICTAIYKHASFEEVFDGQQFECSLSPIELLVTYKDVGEGLLKKKFKVEIKFFTKSVRHHYAQASARISSMRGRVYIAEC
jgi:hypothetical protein